MTHHTDVRQASEDDIPELVRLRALLFQDLGGDFFNPSSAGDDWRDGLAACGIGTVEQWFPGPHSRNGRIGHVIGVVTDPAYRRRGHSRAIMLGLLDWFREREAVRVDLHASREGEPLYRELGFLDHPDPALCWRP
ncbi:GNAT family N-acetyltransferase [Nonomuraea wenchangensis]|uniref:GNAT family N-acetyltransferase n=1 Tax=Nonomuraea wenchangensis TaxID=568860 RepID=UPI00384D04E9